MRRGPWLVPILIAAGVAAAAVAWLALRQPAPRLSAADARRLLREKNVALGRLENQETAAAIPVLESLRRALPDEPLPLRALAVARVVAVQGAGLPAPADLLAAADRAVAAVRRREGDSAAADWLDWHIATNRGDARTALRLTTALVARDPRDVSAWYEKSRALRTLAAGTRSAEADAALAEALDISPRNLWLVVEWLRSLAESLGGGIGEALPDAPERSPGGAAIAAEIRARWDAIAPFAPAIKAFGGIDVRELLEEAADAVGRGDLPRGAARLRALANVLVPQTEGDRREIERHPLEFVLDRFSPEFLARHGLAEAEPPPAIPVTFVRGKAIGPPAPLAADGAGVRCVLLEDVDLDGRCDVLALSTDRVAAFARDPQRGWREIFSADVPAGATGFVAADLDLDFDEARRATAAVRPDTDPRDATRREPARGCPAADLDLVVYGAGGITCLENRFDPAGGGRRLVPYPDSGLAPRGGVAAAAVIDADGDGQLDIVAADDDGLRLFIRRGPGRFAPAGSPDAKGGDGAGSLVPVGFEPRAILPLDFDRDVDVDVVVAGKGGAGWLENLRHGQFRWVPLDEAAAGTMSPLTAIDAIDAGGDASWDLVLGGGSGASLLPLRRTATGVIRREEPRPIAPGTATGIATFDYDNDGLLDLATWGDDGLAILRGLPDGQFTAAPVLAARVSRGVTGFDAADLDGDGDLDAAVVADGGLALLENDGGDAHHWLDVDLEAQQIKGADFAPSGRVNAHGLGGLLELKSGAGYQARFVRRRTTHFGLGPSATVDVVRVAWLNGVPQNIVQPPADLLVCEQQVLLGSCPYLYCWDGERFSFLTDLLWGAPLGLQRAPGQLMPARPWEYLKIPGDRLVPRDGRYVLQITEELWEAAYFDEVKLIVVDHPAGVAIETNEKVGPAEIAAPRIHTLAAPRPPVAARDHRGRDVLPLLAAADGDYLRPDSRKRRQGLLEEHAIELDLGPLADPARATLFLRGWTFPTTVGLNLALARDPALGTPVPPSLSVPDGAGGWRTVLPFMGFPGGKTKTIAIDISGLVPPDDPRVRIATTMEIAWDAAFVTSGEEPAPLTVTELAPLSADLHHRGTSAIEAGSGAGPETFRYDLVSPAAKWPPMLGRFTRHGPVADLLAAEDDLLVVMAAGDEATLEFAVPPGPPAGWSRDFILKSVGWDKDANLATAVGQSVDPLPFTAMRSYPPAPDDEPVATPAREAWLRDRQTRVQDDGYWQAIRRHPIVSQADRR